MATIPFTSAGRRVPALALLVALGLALMPARAADDAVLADRLRAVAHVKECRVTTVGRKTGNPHTVTTWFLVEDDAVYLATLDASRDWVRNARAKGEVSIDFGTLALRGAFADVTDAATEERLHEAMKRKYWMAWIGGLFGRGPEAMFRVSDIELVGA